MMPVLISNEKWTLLFQHCYSFSLSMLCEIDTDEKNTSSVKRLSFDRNLAARSD